jgi:hypothetical protein
VTTDRPLDPDRIADLLEASAATILAELEALGPEARWRPAPGEWCANECLGHILEAERVGELLGEWVHHDRNQVKQILAVVQARVWPQMGNARRFVDPNA